MSTFILLALASCMGDPQTTYCEALCDWASTCATEERGYYPEYDEATTHASCMTEAEAADGDCSKAADGLNPADGKLLSTCTDAIEAESDCSAFTGSIDELKTATTPTDCATMGADAQATFDAARDGAAETNDDLCNRFSWTFCDAVQTCVLGELGISDVSEISDDLITAAGGTPLDICQDKLSSETDSCVSDSSYAPEEDLTSANAMRQGARECLNDFSAVTCDDLFAGNVSATCGAALKDPTVLATALTSVATAFVTE